MKRKAKAVVVRGLERAGVKDQVADLMLARTSQGRRGLKDDRHLAYFMSALLARDFNCVDVGANRGVILDQIVRLAPEGAHVAIEPIPALAQQLRVRHPNVAVHNMALSNERGEATFHIASHHESSGLQKRDWIGETYEEINIPLERLDDLLEPEYRVDFLKVDVEGAQVRVLQGATRILREHRPWIWLEHGDKSAAAYGTSTRDLWDVLTECGYRVWTVDGEGPLSWSEMSATDHRQLWTFFAHR